MSGRRRNGREENRPGGGGKEAPGRLLRDLTFRDPDTIAEAVARDLPEAGDDVQARVTALLAQFASQGMVS